MVLILAAVVGLAAAGGGGWFYLHQSKTTHAAPPETETLHTVHLEGFTVNLADAEENHFLRITIDIGLGHAPKAAKEGESEIPTARVRDAIWQEVKQKVLPEVTDEWASEASEFDTVEELRLSGGGSTPAS